VLDVTLAAMKLRLILNEDRPSPASACHPGPGCAPAKAASASPALRRPIWDVAPETTALVLGLLVPHGDLEALVARFCGEPPGSQREEALRLRVLVASTRRCALAEAVADALDRRSAAVEEMVTGWPMMRIADWWARNRAALAPHEQAALLWRLSSAPGPFLEPLALRVAGHLVAQVTRDARTGAVR